MTAPQVRMLVNGQASDVLPALDRGLAYGDGLFETVRFVDGVAPLWLRHMERLSNSCARLLLPVPDVESLLAEAVQVAQGWAQAVVRITVTRGLGERGYALPAVMQPHRVVAGFAAPAWAADIYALGVRLGVCDIRLAEQPRLAGMKHLNRLEQVLARAEWSDPAVADGLLCDTSGRVVSTTMANLFAVIDGGLVTPSLERCGVAGVARAEILTTQAVQIRDIALDELCHASELFLSSSVRGILPVQAVADTVYVPGPATRAMQRHWRALGFPMEQA